MQVVPVENMARNTHRSGCPINLTVEELGDGWSLVILRDVIFGGRRTFSELLSRSEEGIATNILASRLKRLVDKGLLTKSPDSNHKQRVFYSLTEKSIQLLPLLAVMGAWGRRHLPVSRELSVRAEILESGGPELWETFMEELRAEHLRGEEIDPSSSVRTRLQEAYEEMRDR